MNIVSYQETYDIEGGIDHFLDNLKYADLSFHSEDLISLGITNEQDLEEAIERARLSCSFAGLDLSWHFKDYYIDVNGQLLHAWRLSQLAFLLTFIKADINEQKLAELQLKIIEAASGSFFSDFYKPGNK